MHLNYSGQMTHTTVNITIRCKKKDNKTPSYRLLYDGVIVAERRLAFDVKTYYNKESLTVRDDGVIHRMTLENIAPDDGELWIESIDFKDGDTAQPLSIKANIVDGGFTFICRQR